MANDKYLINTMKGAKKVAAKQSKKEESSSSSDSSFKPASESISDEDIKKKPVKRRGKKGKKESSESSTISADETEDFSLESTIKKLDTKSFNTSEIFHFKVNDYSYSVHKYILKQMHIFDALLDGQIAEGDMFQIIYPNINDDYVTKIIQALYENDVDMFSTNIPVAHKIQIECFMKYLAMDTSFINKVVNEMYDGVHIVRYIDCVRNLPMCEEILKNINMCYVPDKRKIALFKVLIEKIKGFDENFRKTVISFYVNQCVYIKRDNCDIVFGCLTSCNFRILQHMGTSKRKNNMFMSLIDYKPPQDFIVSFYEKIGINYHRKQININFKDTITSIMLDDKELKIFGNTEPANNGVIGFNIYDTLINDIIERFVVP